MADGFRTGLILSLKDAQDDAVLKDAVSRIDNKFNMGSTAPTSETPGQIYYQRGSSSTDAVKVYVKYNGEWYGG